MRRSPSAACNAAIAGRITFAQAKDLRLIALSIFDRSFAVTYLLEAHNLGLQFEELLRVAESLE